WKDDFTAHLEARWNRRRHARAPQVHRHTTDRLDIGSDIFAGSTVAAGRRHRERAGLIDELDAQAIKLGLDDVVDGAVGVQRPAHALVELAELLLTHGVVERQHGERVAHGGEGGGRCGADPLCRRPRTAELRMSLFEFGQPPKEPVVLRIADLGSVEDIVAVIVMIDGAPQVVDLLTNGGGSTLSARHAAYYNGSKPRRKVQRRESNHAVVVN